MSRACLESPECRGNRDRQGSRQQCHETLPVRHRTFAVHAGHHVAWETAAATRRRSGRDLTSVPRSVDFRKLRHPGADCRPRIHPTGRLSLNGPRGPAARGPGTGRWRARTWMLARRGYGGEPDGPGLIQIPNACSAPGRVGPRDRVFDSAGWAGRQVVSAVTSPAGLSVGCYEPARLDGQAPNALGIQVFFQFNLESVRRKTRFFGQLGPRVRGTGFYRLKEPIRIPIGPRISGESRPGWLAGEAWS